MDTYKFIDNELAVLTMEYSNRTWMEDERWFIWE